MKESAQNMSRTWIVSSWKTLKWSLKQLISPARIESLILLVIIFIQGILPGLSLVVIERVVNWLANSSQTATPFPFTLVALWSFSLLIQYCLYPLLSLVRLTLNEKVLTHCNVQIMQKANSLRGLASFENTTFFDNVQLLQKEAKNKPLHFAYIVVGFSTGIISILSMSFVLSTIHIMVPLALLVAAIPHAMATLLIEKASWDQELFKSPVARKMNWLSATLLDEKAAKEVRLFGFGNYFVQRYEQLAKTVLESVRMIRLRECRTAILLSALTVVGNVGIFLWLINNRTSFEANIGALVMALQGFVLIQGELASLIEQIATLYPVLGFFQKLKFFLSKVYSHDLPVSKHPKAIKDIYSNITFEHVSFAYADGKPVLQDVHFTIYAKEKLALVGENGAGKSTLVKLLMRLYDPTTGRITVDGTDLREIDITAWRKLISAVFQDYGQYFLTVGENIGLGNPEEMQNQEKIEQASLRAGFQKVNKKLKDGFKTLLGKEFGGTNLSGGEWQKLAMARALMKTASLLILDEPTAALDPRSEYELFQKFADNAANKTTLFITHRLGSVLLADRIIVLKDGRVVEEGTHAELLKKGQDYATLFRMQATQYGASL